MSIDFSTKYLGLTLATPLVASASPITANIETLQQLEECGAGAAVLPSLFAEQIQQEEIAVGDFYNDAGDAHGESPSYFPELDLYNLGRDNYLKYLIHAKKAVKIPIIASLNCRGPGQWIHEASRLEEAGADALELNIYDVVTDPDLTSTQVEDGQLEIVDSIRSQIQIPLAIKIGPSYSSLPNFGKRLSDAGANGLVLFNRYLEPELNLSEMDVQPHLQLSDSNEMRLPLRWTAILRDLLPISLAATSGVHSASDALKLLLAGADVTMMASALLRNGVKHIEAVLMVMKQWMEDQEYESVLQMQGRMSHKNCPDRSGFERAAYIKAIVSYAEN